MCGILGVYGPDAAAVPERVGEVVRSSLHHRGPDAEGTKLVRGSGATCVMGHSRLRIIDISPEGDQPLSNEDRSIWVLFNGEIYNHPELRAELERTGHRFRSRTDTEVIVHLYEQCGGDAEAMLGRLRGMFAIALFDVARSRLILARDRLGIKPLYWSRRNGQVAFGSEVRALSRLGFGDGPNEDALWSYIAWGVVTSPETIVSGIEELPSGHVASIEPGKVTVRRWWTMPVPGDEPTVEDPSVGLRGVLTDSVGRHLVADRPVGVFLSSGVDSNAVAKIAALTGKVKALTVSFDGSDLDEGAAASALADRMDVEHTLVQVHGREVVSELGSILGSMDQPTSDGVNTWLVSRAAREAGLVVALAGTGGDELFGGYPSFRVYPRLRRARSLLGIVPEPARRIASGALARSYPGHRTVKALSAGSGSDGAYAATRALFSRFEVERIGGHYPDRNGDELPVDPIDQVSVLEISRYLKDQLLRDTDQMAMAHSLEVRVPLLDDAVVDYAMRLPSAVRTAPGKGLLIQAAGLPRLEKRGFTLPFDQWLRGPLSEDLRRGLLSDELPFAEILPLSFRQTLWDSYQAGRCHWSRPWAVSVLRMWPSANGFDW